MMHSSQSAERPLGELFKELATETATLVRHEVELVRVETGAKVREAGATTMQLVAGGAIAVMGALVLLGAAVLILALAMPLWAAALLVGLLVTGVGGVLVARSLRAFKRFDLMPRETIQTLQEDKQWLREQVSR